MGFCCDTTRAKYPTQPVEQAAMNINTKYAQIRAVL